MLVETGAFAATTTPALFERYTFYLEPLLCSRSWSGSTRGFRGLESALRVALGVPVLLLLSLTLAQIVSPDAVNGVTLGALYRFSVHLPGGIHELKAAIAVAAVLAELSSSRSARGRSRGLRCRCCSRCTSASPGTSIIDNTRNVGWTRDRGQ